MMTMSKALSAAGAVKYFKEEYEHARGSYYTEEGKAVGRWSGELAEHFGLSGAVNRADFERLCEGQDPRTSEQLVRHVKPHERTNQKGKEIETGGHRAGFDITFSAPKSVSLAAIVGGDERIIDAHAEAVSATLQEVEKYAQARLGGNTPAETTGKLLFASFQHDAARPDQKGGYAAPDLHTHNFAFNLTQTREGKIKPLQPHEIYKCQQYGKALYRAKLAEGLQKLGYEIRVDKETDAPELVGISRAYIEASSPRKNEIKETQKALGAKSTRRISDRNRRTKVYDRDEMKARHQELDRQHGGQARGVVGEAREQAQAMSALLWDEGTSRAKAQESVTFAIEKGSEREAVSDMRELMTDALRRNYGRTTVEAVAAEMEARQERGQLVGLVLDDETKRRMTTEKMLRRESENIEAMRAGQGAHQPIGERVPKTLTTSRGVTLSESQRAAVEQIVTSRDQITGLQGKAGTGKTTTLAVVREAAEQAGYDVQGFAPTTRATQLLAESGMQTRTLQKFIRQKDEPEAAPRLLVLDESSLASTKQVHSFLSRVRPEDRVLLVGDVRQHEGVEAGSPFAQLQRHGMETAHLEQIVRQKDEPLREVVENLSAGRIKEAVDGLREQGRITEIADPQERLKTIARDFCEQPDSERRGTLVISPANKERVELNRLIHRELQQTGKISTKNYKTKVLENRNELTGAERTFAGAYQQDDVIRYTSGSKKHGISAGEYARVVATDEKTNTLTVKLDKSQQQISYDPKRLQGVSVYREAERELSAGDRLQFRAPFHAQKVTNGELGTLEKIEKGRLTVALDSGRSVEFPIDKNRHIDHGYAVTSHSSQGQTVNRVLVNADTSEPSKLLNQRMAYVATSRARLDARIYTDSDQRLNAALARQVDKSTALEASRETKVRNVPRLLPMETPATRPEPTRAERPAGIERPAAVAPARPPAERATRPQPEATRPTDSTRQTDLTSAAYQQTLRGIVGQQGEREQLPIPARPPARPYTTTTPVDANRPAAEMSAELVKMANENHRDLTGQDIAAPVQKFMQQIFTQQADRPPTEKQLENLEATSKALGLTEPPQMSTSLQSALWRAHNAPDRAEILEQITQATTTAYTQHQQQQARTIELPEPSRDIGMSID
jgi:conjugative relaxase-like TrwC/TraI family protein